MFVFHFSHSEYWDVDNFFVIAETEEDGRILVKKEMESGDRWSFTEDHQEKVNADLYLEGSWPIERGIITYVCQEYN
jgi:hypothetical protein